MFLYEYIQWHVEGVFNTPNCYDRILVLFILLVHFVNINCFKIYSYVYAFIS